MKKDIKISKGILIFLIIGWGIALFSATAFVGLLVYDITGSKIISDNGKILGTEANSGLNAASDIFYQSMQDSDISGRSATIDYNKIPAIATDDNIIGAANKVTVLVYCDFQCQFCERYQETLRKVLKNYPKDVRLVYRHFPLKNNHPLAMTAAQAAECAGEQGKFWDMHDKIFAGQDLLAIDNLKSWAADLGLDSEQFNECFDNEKYFEKINSQLKAAVSAGIIGTPVTFINQEFVRGEAPLELLTQIIDSQIKK